MRLKPIERAVYTVLAPWQPDGCEVWEFLTTGEAAYSASRKGLVELIRRAASLGLNAFPSKLCHQVNKNPPIYEFIKGDLRLFFFRGTGNQIAICCCGTIKKGQKVDPASVNKAVAYYHEYQDAVLNNTLKVE